MSTKRLSTFGRYSLQEKLAERASAQVYLASKRGPEGFSKRVALKCYSERLSARAGFREAFLADAGWVAQLNHANLAHIFEMGEAEGRLFVAMEPMEGQSLERVLDKCRERARQIPPGLATHICAEACAGLEHLHNFDAGPGRPPIHGNFSAKSVMLTRNGLVKIVDAGTARAEAAVRRSPRQHLSHLAPEQVQGQRQPDRRADVYACGALILRMLIPGTQARPDPQQLPPDTPEELRRIVRQALARNPEQRYPDCRSMRRELLAFLQGQPHSIDSYELTDFLQALEQARPQGPQSEPLEWHGEGSTVVDGGLAGRDIQGGGKSLAPWLLIAALLPLGVLAFLFWPADSPPDPPPATVPSLVQQKAQAEARRAREKERKTEELKEAFEQHMARGTERTRDPEQLMAAVQDFIAAKEIAWELGMDPSVQDRVRDKLAASRAALDKRDRELAEKQRSERLATAQAEAARQKNRPKKPRSNNALRNKGLQAFRLADHEKAARYFERALKVNPRDWDLYIFLGRTYLRLKQNYKACTAFSHYLAACPKCKKTTLAKTYLKTCRLPSQ